MEKYLPYAKLNIMYNITSNGFTHVNGLEKVFTGFTARDKVICRSDLLSGLDDVFEEKTLSTYRELIYYIVAGLISDNKEVSELVTEFYAKDKRFKEFVATLFYMEQSEEPFGRQIINTLKSKIVATENIWKQHFRGSYAKVFETANAYIYYAVEDMDFTLCVPTKCECEVLSCGKVWKGNTTRKELS